MPRWCWPASTLTWGVGWHVNLTSGAPVLPPRDVPTLVDRRGQFRPLQAQLGGLLAGTTNRQEVARELRAQLAIMLDAGLQPTHVDGHLHAHAFPGVFPIVLRLLAEHQIPALRSPALSAWFPTTQQKTTNPWAALHPRNRLAALIAAGLNVPPLLHGLQWLTPRLEQSRLAALQQAGVVYPTRMIDAARSITTPVPAASFAAALAAEPAHLIEVMAHPAWNRDPTGRGAAEVALLTDPALQSALATQQVVCGSYRAYCAAQTIPPGPSASQGELED